MRSRPFTKIKPAACPLVRKTIAVCDINIIIILHRLRARDKLCHEAQCVMSLPHFLGDSMQFFFLKGSETSLTTLELHVRLFPLYV